MFVNKMFTLILHQRHEGKMNLNNNVTNVDIMTPSIRSTDLQTSVEKIKSDGQKIQSDENGMYEKAYSASQGIGQNIDIQA